MKSNKEAVRQIKFIAGRLDVVIANANVLGAGYKMQSASEADTEGMVELFNINTLFQATYPLLKNSTNPRFTVISSPAGSIEVGSTYPIKNLAYGTSKAALNYVVRKIHSEYPDIVVFPPSPGLLVATEMVAKASVPYPPTIIPAESAQGILKLVDNATREKDGGKFLCYDGTTFAW